MKIVLLPELAFGQADAISSYLNSKNFHQFGRVFQSRTEATEAGKFLLLPDNIECIKTLDFGSDKYLLELDADLEFLTDTHHTVPATEEEEEKLILNGDYFNAVESLDATKVKVLLNNQNWRELVELFDFTEGSENIFANTKATAHEKELYTPEVEDEE